MALGARHLLSLWKFGAFRREQVVHLHRHFVDDRAARNPVAVDRPFFQTNRYWTVMRVETKVVAFFQKHDSVIGFAKLAGAFDNGLKNRRDIGWRGSNHAEDVAAPGLV